MNFDILGSELTRPTPQKYRPGLLLLDVGALFIVLWLAPVFSVAFIEH
jgi:hypothetical protein